MRQPPTNHCDDSMFSTRERRNYSTGIRIFDLFAASWPGDKWRNSRLSIVLG